MRRIQALYLYCPRKDNFVLLMKQVFVRKPRHVMGVKTNEFQEWSSTRFASRSCFPARCTCRFDLWSLIHDLLMIFKVFIFTIRCSKTSPELGNAPNRSFDLWSLIFHPLLPLQNYPMDIQTCLIDVASYAYTDKDISEYNRLLFFGIIFFK